ncbi:hypothetical protein H8959_000071 [Pygathrix nigripes]
MLPGIIARCHLNKSVASIDICTKESSPRFLLPSERVLEDLEEQVKDGILRLLRAPHQKAAALGGWPKTGTLLSPPQVSPCTTRLCMCA